MSARSNPFEELERLFDRMRREFEDSTYAWDTENPLAEWRSRMESMRLDLAEHDEEFVATVDLPGYERDDVDVRVTDHTLRIDAEHHSESEESEDTTSTRSVATSRCIARLNSRRRSRKTR